MLLNMNRFREMCFLMPDQSSGKGKLKSMKKAMHLLIVLVASGWLVGQRPCLIV